MNDSPEQIVERMRAMNVAVYSARWADDDDESVAACVIVDGGALADKLIRFVRDLERTP